MSISVAGKYPKMNNFHFLMIKWLCSKKLIGTSQL